MWTRGRSKTAISRCFSLESEGEQAKQDEMMLEIGGSRHHAGVHR